jgi:hypothetical protein
MLKTAPHLSNNWKIIIITFCTIKFKTVFGNWEGGAWLNDYTTGRYYSKTEC